MKRIYGIVGKIGSGKDTFAEELASMCVTPVERHAFGDKLKENVELITGERMLMKHPSGNPYFNPVFDYDRKVKNKFLKTWNMTVGEMLQRFGTDAAREHFDSDIWVKALFETSVKEATKNDHIVVIPDVRFPNEAEYIRENGGVLIKLIGDPMGIRQKSTRDLNHISETALDTYGKFHHIIDNSKPNINLLRDNISKIMEIYDIR